MGQGDSGPQRFMCMYQEKSGSESLGPICLWKFSWCLKVKQQSTQTSKWVGKNCGVSQVLKLQCRLSFEANIKNLSLRLFMGVLTPSQPQTCRHGLSGWKGPQGLQRGPSHLSPALLWRPSLGLNPSSAGFHCLPRWLIPF